MPNRVKPLPPDLAAELWSTVQANVDKMIHAAYIAGYEEGSGGEYPPKPASQILREEVAIMRASDVPVRMAKASIYHEAAAYLEKLGM